MPNVDPTPLGAYLRRLVGEGTEVTALTDLELIRRFARSRDPAAFEVLVWRHGPMVWATCRRVLRHRQDAEDAFQATFLALARAAGSVGRRGSAAAWLHRVATNAALKLRAKRPVTGLARESALPAVAPDGGEFAAAVDEELQKLPERARAAFVLCCLEGMSSAEAARELGCPAGTVDSRLHAARARLRRRLTLRGFGPGALAALLAVEPPPAAVAGALRSGSGACPDPAVSRLADQVIRGMTMRATLVTRALMGVFALAAVLAVAWGLSRPGEGLHGAPAPRPPDRGEGQIVLWRQGHPVAVDPRTKETAALAVGSEGKRGNLWLSPDGESVLVYVANRLTLRPDGAADRDRLYLRPLAGRDAEGGREVEVEGVSLCHAFWSADGRTVYGYGLTETPGDPVLTTDFVNWSFDPRTGKAERLRLPGNVSILDRSPDGRAYLAIRYEKPGGVPGTYRVGVLSADGETFTPLTGEKEAAPADFRFSPDGKRALGRVYREERGGLVPELVVFDLKTGKRTAVATPEGASVSGACWSPDGKRIAFAWEPAAVVARRHEERDGPAGAGDRYELTVTVARPDGTEPQDVYSDTEYPFGSIDWR